MMMMMMMMTTTTTNGDVVVCMLLLLLFAAIGVLSQLRLHTFIRMYLFNASYLNERERRQHPYLQFIDEEWRLLGVDFHKLGIEVLFAEHVHVFVHHLARPVLPIEVAHHSFGLLHFREKCLLIEDFPVFTVAPAREFFAARLRLTQLFHSPFPKLRQVVVIVSITAARGGFLEIGRRGGQSKYSMYM